MGSFSIKTEQTKKVAEQEESLIKELAAIELRISSVKNGIQLGSATSQIRNRLKVTASDVSQERRCMKEMKKGLEGANSSYVQTENKLLGNGSQTAKPPIASIAAGIAGGVLMPQNAFSAILFNRKPGSLFKNFWAVLFPNWVTGESHLLTDWVQNKLDNSNNPFLDIFGFKAADDDEMAKASINLVKALHNSDLSKDNFWKKQADKIKNFNDKNKHPGFKGYFDKNGRYHNIKDEKDQDESKEKKKYDDISSLNKEATIASIGTKVSGSILGINGEGSCGIASGSYDVAVGKGEANASAFAGLYSYSADGKKHFTPGFGAEVGIGVTAFSASATGQLGNEYFNAHGKISMDVGKAEAKASVNVGLIDADGKFNPQAGVKFSAEALAAEVKGTVGGTIAGTSVEATGNINFGIGGHADFGFVDGHISVDIGASLGVGIGVKLDIDMSGTINAVADTVSSAWTAFKGWFK